MQLTYSQTPDAYHEGDLADIGPHNVISTIAETTADLDIEPGLVVLRGTDPDRQARLPTSPAADVDAIAETVGSTAGVQTLDGAELDGVIGDGIISPAARITFICDAHTDWDATEVTLLYENEDGVLTAEMLDIATSSTATSVGYARRVLSVTIPAQTGAGGTATIGVSAARILGGADVLGVVQRTHKARRDGASADCEDYEDESRMPVVARGRIAVACETAFAAGSAPLVRCVAAGAERLGALRVGDTDSGDCVPWKGARFVTSGTAGAIGELEVLGQ